MNEYVAVGAGSVAATLVYYYGFRRMGRHLNPWHRYDRWATMCGTVVIFLLWPYAFAASEVGPLYGLLAIPMWLVTWLLVAFWIVYFERRKQKKT